MESESSETKVMNTCKGLLLDEGEGRRGMYESKSVEAKDSKEGELLVMTEGFVEVFDEAGKGERIHRCNKSFLRFSGGGDAVV